MSSLPPYAGPAGNAATVTPAHRPDARRPYVPAPWRPAPVLPATPVDATAAAASVELSDVATTGSPTEVAAASSPAPATAIAALFGAEDRGRDDASDALPSIEAFLHVAPTVAAGPHAEADVPAGSPAMTPSDASSDAIGAVDEAALRGEDWAMDDAAADVHALASGLVPPEAVRDLSPLLPPLPMWSDDDIMDIMPVSRPSTDDAAQRLFGAVQDPVAPSARAQEDAGAASSDAMQGSVAAAEALETLAQRIRDGELPIPGYAPGMGDAAALAAALASILGLRR